MQTLAYDPVIPLWTAKSIAHFNFRTDELAADVGDALADEDKLPLHVWLETAVTDGEPGIIPEGRPNLPDATDMLHESEQRWQGVCPGLEHGFLRLPAFHGAPGERKFQPGKLAALRDKPAGWN